MQLLNLIIRARLGLWIVAAEESRERMDWCFCPNDGPRSPYVSNHAPCTENALRDVSTAFFGFPWIHADGQATGIERSFALSKPAEIGNRIYQPSAQGESVRRRSVSQNRAFSAETTTF